MKPGILFAILFFLLIKVSSQIEINKFDGNLKEYTLYIEVRDTTREESKLFMSRLKDIWSVSELKFYTPSANFANVIGDNRKVLSTRISMETKEVTRIDSKTGFQSTTSYTHWYYHLVKAINIEIEGKSGIKYIENEFAKIALFDPKEGKYVTLNYGLLLNYLTIFQECLKSKITSGLYRSKVPRSKTEFTNLKAGKSLYIPEYAFMSYNKFKGTYSEANENKLMKGFKYKYKRISESDLERKILSSSKDFYYLLYVRSCTDKYIMVVNGHTGALLYTFYRGVSYNLKPKDIRRINKAIKKS